MQPPRFQAFFRQLNSLGALKEIPSEGLIIDDVPDEEFPLDFEGIVIARGIGHFLPALKEINRLRLVRVPYGAGRVLGALRPAFPQAGHGRSFGAIDLQRQEVVPAHPHAPGTVEMGDDAPIGFKGRVGGVVRRARVRPALLIAPLGNMGSAAAGDGRHVAKEVVDDIAPMTEHIDGDAAPVLLAVVP